MQVTVEYMIMVPVMILQIFLFPYVAVVIMDSWTTSRQTLQLQEVAEQLGSTIQQMYYTINRATVSSSDAYMKVNLEIPQTIENRPYTVTFRNVSGIDSAYKVMNITLQFTNRDRSTSTLVTLGDNVNWQDNLSFNSTTRGLCLIGSCVDGIITLTLEEER